MLDEMCIAKRRASCVEEGGGGEIAAKYEENKRRMNP